MESNILEHLYFYLYSHNSMTILTDLVPLIELKWYIDYFKMKDKLCDTKSATKFEIESMRYSLCNFLIVDDEGSYQKIQKSYQSWYYTLLTIMTVILISIIALIIYYKSYTAHTALVVITVFLFIYMIIINTFILANFKKINVYMNDSNSDIYKYYRAYKILNAIMKISRLQDALLEYNYDKLNEKEETLDIMLEKNIASSENLTNSADIQNIKASAYNDLDFLKYLCFDMLSPYYLKYFDNPYIRMPTKLTKQFDTTENVYLKELYMKHQKTKENNQSEVDKLYSKLNTVLTPYKSLYPKLDQFFDSKIKVYFIQQIIDEVERSITDDNRKKEFSTFKDTNIKPILDDIEAYEGVYDMINKLIHSELSGHLVSVPDDDYIAYYLNHQDLLFDKTKTKDIIGLLEYQGNFVFGYIIFWLILFLFVSHSLAGTAYMYFLLGTLLIYLCIVWINVQYTFVST